MRRRWKHLLFVVAVGLAGVPVVPTTAVSAPPVPALELGTAPDGLGAYRVAVTGPEILLQLGRQGFDVSEGVVGSEVEVVATGDQAAKLRGLGLTVKETARKTDPASTYNVWRPYYDKTYVGTAKGKKRETIYEEYQRLAREHKSIVKPEIIGKSVHGKPIIALRVTKNARTTRDGAKPALVYTGLLHGREWLTGEQTRRLTYLFLDNYGKKGQAKGLDGRPIDGVTAAELTKLVDTREIWFVPVINPDGYDISFTPDNRLWRKTVRDTNGDGQTQFGDGIDLNRNFAAHFGLDNEGSSPDPAYETYRGPNPNSEPEAKALDDLLARVGFEFFIAYHVTATGERLLYGNGFQDNTASEDDPIYRALAGDNDHPAIGTGPPGAANVYQPGLLSYPFRNNGIADDQAHGVRRALTFTVEMDAADPARGGGGSVFEFQDNEADVNQAFLKNLPFALDLARSAADPANPVSHLGTTAPSFELHPFAVSYGDPQTVRVNVKRALGPVTLHWKIGDGRERTTRTTEFQGGERYGGQYDVYYHNVQGTVTGTKPGDRVTVWFTAGGQKSDSFTYEARSDTGNPVLIMAAEDYSGAPGSTLESPAYADRTKANYLQYYKDALAANGIRYDVYDVDAEGRTAPDALGVLAHYKAVVWYTANDSFIRTAGAPGRTGTGKLAADEILNVRDYLNEGGKLLYSGQAGANAQLLGAQFNPRGEPPYCDTTGTGPGTVKNCSLLTDDFLQYWLGAYTHIEAATDKGQASTLPFEAGGKPFSVNGPDSADNQVHAYSAVTTSSLLPPDQFPQFKSDVVVGFTGPALYDPASGTRYANVRSDPRSYSRLRQTIDLTGATAADLQFKISYDTEATFDHVIVEAHRVGQDDWTTLPDANGHTTTDVGASCDLNWDTLHPHLAHYQTNANKAAADCTGTGTTGVWNSATGNSRGYQDWKLDLSAYAGSQVEVSISYIQDFAVNGLGVFLDDVTVTRDGAVATQTSFEDGLGGWTAGPPPPGSEENAVGGWLSRTTVGYHAGPGIATKRTVYWGFGLEGVQGAGNRAALLAGALRHLGVRPRGDHGPATGQAPS